MKGVPVKLDGTEWARTHDGEEGWRPGLDEIMEKAVEHAPICSKNNVKGE
jgi:hypothetical protein